MPESYVTVSVLENGIEAQLLESILMEQGIPHRIISHHDTAYDGLFQFQKGWGVIQAPSSHTAEVLDILKGVRTDPAVG